ncbi:MAG: glutaredoxin domain-containing protein [Actinomycetota bacterium]|nr:glutaredoxin domain-containing protein [Actinomycetota bacterium]
MSDAAATPQSSSGGPQIVVYSRPMCSYCFLLRSALRRAELPFTEVNIWDDPQAAAFVRSVAGGNETVPTVTVGEVAVVNPSAAHVRELWAGGIRR